MNMYERIKTMTMEEMREFVYWVYLCGNRDGRDCLEDDFHESCFFGGSMLVKDMSSIMPKNAVSDLLDVFEEAYGEREGSGLKAVVEP